MPGEPTSFAVALLPTANRIAAGHRLRLTLTSDDSDGSAMQGLAHTHIGLPARNRVHDGSSLPVPLAAGRLA